MQQRSWSGPLKAFRVKLVVNQVRSEADHSVGRAVVAAWKKFFGLEMDYLGGVAYDDTAWQMIRKRRPLLVDGADSPSATQLVAVAAPWRRSIDRGRPR